MNIYQWMDTVQTAMLIVVGGVMVYLLLLFRQELKGAAGALREVVSTQSQLQQNVRRAWERIDALEAQFTALADRLQRLENSRPGPPGPSP